MTQSSSKTIQDALDLAASRNVLTQDSKSLIIAGLNQTTLPAQIGGSLDFGTTYPILLKLIVDASGSMTDQRQAMVTALNRLKDLFEADSLRTGAEYFVSITDFNSGRGLHLMRAFNDASVLPTFTPADYQPDGLTPLFDAVYQGIAETAAYGAQAFGIGATGFQMMIVVLSDGADNDSRHTAAEVNRFLAEFNSLPNFVIAFIGFGDMPSEHVFFTDVATKMGVHPANIRIYDSNDPDCLNQVIVHISSSAKVRSQRAATSQTQSGNFFAF